MISTFLSICLMVMKTVSPLELGLNVLVILPNTIAKEVINVAAAIAKKVPIITMDF